MSEREKVREAGSIAKLCDRYLTDHAEPFKKASSNASDRQIIEASIKPRLGSTSVRAATRADVLKMQRGLSATPIAANRTLALLSKMLNLDKVFTIHTGASRDPTQIRLLRPGIHAAAGCLWPGAGSPAQGRRRPP